MYESWKVYYNNERKFTKNHDIKKKTKEKKKKKTSKVNSIMRDFFFVPIEEIHEILFRSKKTHTLLNFFVFPLYVLKDLPLCKFRDSMSMDISYRLYFQNLYHIPVVLEL